MEIRQRKMLEFTEKITKKISDINEEDKVKLRDVGFNDRDIWDIANVAVFNMTMIASAVAMRPNEEYHQQSR